MATGAPRTRSKYRSVLTEAEGITFPSKAEALRWGELRLLERAGLIRDLQRQVAFVLAEGVRLAGEAKAKPALRFIADFVYTDTDNGRQVVEDCKSPATAAKEAYRIKKHLMKSVLGIDILESAPRRR